MLREIGKCCPVVPMYILIFIPFLAFRCITPTSFFFVIHLRISGVTILIRRDSLTILCVTSPMCSCVLFPVYWVLGLPQVCLRPRNLPQIIVLKGLPQLDCLKYASDLSTCLKCWYSYSRDCVNLYRCWHARLWRRLVDF